MGQHENKQTNKQCTLNNVHHAKNTHYTFFLPYSVFSLPDSVFSPSPHPLPLSSSLVCYRTLPLVT